MIRRLNLVVVFSLLVPALSHAASILRVDIGRSGQFVESGYTEFSTPGLAGDLFVPQSFAGGTWDLEFGGLGITTRSYGDIPTSPLGDLLEDSVLMNSSPDGGFMDLVFDGLAPGTYSLTTYHHSFGFGGATAEVLGGLEGTAPVLLTSVTSTTGTNISNFATLTTSFTTTAGIDGYTLRFDPENAAGSFHFDLSGFDLDLVAVPEPGMGVFLGLSLVGFASQGVRGRRV